MSESKHTPGPWMAEGPPNNIHIVEAARPHMRVCFLTSDGPTKANANLIAAAPDLLDSIDPETLDAIADEIDCHEHSARAASLRLLAKRQRTALSRAEGRKTEGAAPPLVDDE